MPFSYSILLFRWLRGDRAFHVPGRPFHSERDHRNRFEPLNKIANLNLEDAEMQAHASHPQCEELKFKHLTSYVAIKKVIYFLHCSDIFTITASIFFFTSLIFMLHALVLIRIEGYTYYKLEPFFFVMEFCSLHETGRLCSFSH